MDIVHSSRGWMIPLLTCLCCLFSAPLSSSSARGSIDKHYVTVHCLMLTWRKTHSHTQWTIASDSTRLDAHLDTFRSLLFQITVTECNICTVHLLLRKKTLHTIHLPTLLHTSNLRNMNGVWAEHLSINRMLWRVVWTRGNRQGIVLPGLSVSGL